MKYSDVQWFFFDDNSDKQGPISFNALKALHKSKHINNSTLIWCNKLKNWTPLGQVFKTEPPPIPSMGQEQEPPQILHNNSIADYVQPQPITNVKNKKPKNILAPSGLRLLARFLDLVLFTIIGSIIMAILIEISQYTSRELNAIGFIINAIYTVWGNSSACGSTPGKLAVGIRVVNADGKQLSVGNAFGRHVADILNMILFLVLYLMIPFTKNKQGLHDMLASTYVVKSSATDDEILAYIKREVED